MLDIFGSDDKKKEDLRENMDKIRDLVEDQGQGSRQRQDRQQSGGQDQPAPPPQQDRPQQPQQEGGDGQQRRQQPQQGQQQAQGGQQESGQGSTDVEMTRPHREAGDGQRTSSRQVRQRGQDQGQRQQGQQDRDAELDVSEDEIPEPPETKEIEVPDIQKGPLFIRVRKFKEAKQMVSRMRELNSDMETQMGGLRNTLEEDRESTRRLNDAMKRLQDSMNTIRDIVSPG